MIIYEKYNDFKVRLLVENFKEHEELMLKKAVKLMARALGDIMFKEYCINYRYKIKHFKWTWSGKKTWYKEYKGFFDVGNLTQHQIYCQVMKGEEVLSEDGEDGEADIFLRIDRSDKPGVIGYTYPSSIWQWIYSRIFREYGPETVAGNLAHEWVHKLGFSHKKKKRKKHTPPYAIGYYVRDFLEFNRKLG